MVTDTAQPFLGKKESAVGLKTQVGPNIPKEGLKSSKMGPGATAGHPPRLRS
jgi:hypothetical protein